MNEKMQPVELTDLNDIHPSKKIGDIVLVDKAPHVTVLTLCQQNDVKHVVQKSNISSAAEIDFSNQSMISPALFFKYPLSCIFGQSQIDSKSEAEISGISFPVERLEDRPVILSYFESYVKRLTPSPALLNDVLTVVDESMTNAVYSAPNGPRKHPHSSSTDHSSFMDSNQKPVLFAGHDTERIVVGCRDYYGTLDAKALVDRIKKCYENDVGDMINFGEGGAGIGTFLMFDSCASMYIGVDPGLSTTICCSFPLKLSASKRKDLPKNIHLLYRDVSPDKRNE